MILRLPLGILFLLSLFCFVLLLRRESGLVSDTLVSLCCRSFGLLLLCCTSLVAARRWILGWIAEQHPVHQLSINPTTIKLSTDDLQLIFFSTLPIRLSELLTIKFTVPDAPIVCPEWKRNGPYFKWLIYAKREGGEGRWTNQCASRFHLAIKLTRIVKKKKCLFFLLASRHALSAIMRGDKQLVALKKENEGKQNMGR